MLITFYGNSLGFTALSRKGFFDEVMKDWENGVAAGTLYARKPWLCGDYPNDLQHLLS